MKFWIKRLQVIVKTVERCNIDCSYCYYFNGGDETYKKRPPYISRSVIDGLASFLSEACNSCILEELEIVFHGGEPLMQKKHDFEYMCSVLHKLLSGSTRLRFAVQTNGMLIDDEWIGIFAKHDVVVGVSLDGTDVQNDRFRIDKIGKGTYHRAAAGLSKLVKAFDEGIVRQRPAILTVINPDYDYSDIMEHFYTDLEIKRFGILLPDTSYDQSSYEDINHKSFGSAMKDIFRKSVQYEDIKISQITRLLNVFQKYRPSNIASEKRKSMDAFRDNKGTYIDNQIIVIQSDGSITLDDSFIPATEWRKDNSSGNVSKDNLVGYLEKPIFSEIREAYENLPDKCRSCDVKALCKGGDLENRYSSKNGFNNPSIYCDSLYDFYSEVVSFLYNTGYPKEDLLEVLNLDVCP